MKLTPKQKQLVKEYAKSLSEGMADLRSVIENIPIDTAQKLGDLYYSIAENTEPMVDLLDSLNEENPSRILQVELDRFKKINFLIQNCKLGRVL